MTLSQLLTLEQFLHADYPAPNEDHFSGLGVLDVVTTPPVRGRDGHFTVIIPTSAARNYQLEACRLPSARVRFCVVEADTLTREKLIEIVAHVNGFWLDTSTLTTTFRGFLRSLPVPLTDIADLVRSEKETAPCN